MEDFVKIPFEKLTKEWALVTSGTKENFNSMTIAWGGVGSIWFKPAVTIYIHPDRYTFGFLKENDIFTVSFFGEENKKALQIMGSQSGRDVDKVAVSGLTPEFLENGGITYKEATQTFVCKKIYTQKMDKIAFPEDVIQSYPGDTEPHYMFIGEVID